MLYRLRGRTPGFLEIDFQEKTASLLPTPFYLQSFTHLEMQRSMSAAENALEAHFGLQGLSKRGSVPLAYCPYGSARSQRRVKKHDDSNYNSGRTARGPRGHVLPRHSPKRTSSGVQLRAV